MVCLFHKQTITTLTYYTDKDLLGIALTNFGNFQQKKGRLCRESYSISILSIIVRFTLSIVGISHEFSKRLSPGDFDTGYCGFKDSRSNIQKFEFRNRVTAYI